MTAPKCLYLIATVVAVFGWGSVALAEDDVTVVSSSSTTTPPPKKTTDADGTPVVHKSSHKKKHTDTETASSSTVLPAPAATPSAPPVQTPVVTSAPVTSVPPVSSVVAGPVPAATISTDSSGSPAVETGLPVARYPGMGAPIRGVSTYQPLPTVLPSVKPIGTTAGHQTYYASTLPISVLPLTSSAAGSFSPTHPAGIPDFTFAPPTRKVKNTYPWRPNILTTMFWIGEGSTPLSTTTNVQSSWDEDWLSNNHGSDNPYNRNGYASGNHASTLNPFYCALPFNDLAFPDKARRWLPAGWYRKPKDGRQVSACQHRWVEIKNSKGDVCYAQWEDVGPLRYDHAEYVFGGDRPTGMGDDHAGLDVSPAVADYLNLTDHNRYMSWRFVDDEDVRPGAWLKLDEQAVLYTALHQMKSSASSPLPIQRANEPIEDSSDADSNKKKVDAKKG